MDPERPYPSRYGYYYNTPTHPAPGTGYGSDPRQDNPFLPRSSAGDSAGLGPTQEYVICGRTIPFFHNSPVLEAVLNLTPPKDMVNIANYPTHLPKTIVRDLNMTRWGGCRVVSNMKPLVLGQKQPEYMGKPICGRTNNNH
ncbi:hypothetical protein HYE67_010096 [Fusarium culmorum]|uniref:Uncharacterized protein n=1 Tax=Fusarium culmorum TaxID=5516 RepID=A0A2T4HC37_FUSCU|nr:hypothetical protein FCULG_00005050 [Fusarium culmorum]QPC67865.1 hypothetical protein HYE67_010096 [Fusarium culmorum]